MSAATPNAPGGLPVTIVVDRLSADNVRELVGLFDTARPVRDPHRLAAFIEWAFSDGTAAGNVAARKLGLVIGTWGDLTPDQQRAATDLVKDAYRKNEDDRYASQHSQSPTGQPRGLRLVVNNAH